METKEKLEKNIEIFYERNNMKIPEVEVQHYFKNDPYARQTDSPNESKIEKQYRLYKKFLVSQRIKERQRGVPYYSTPDDVDARYSRFQNERTPLAEREHMRRIENSADTRQPQIVQPLVEIFSRSDLRDSVLEKEQDPEKIGLLNEFNNDQIMYPEIIAFDQPPVYDTYEPIQDDEPMREETKIQEEPIQEKLNTGQGEGARAVAAPTKDNFVIHHVQHDDTIGKLCLMYNVNKDIIRMANDFLGEEIYMFKTLKIPYTYGKMMEAPKSGKSEEEVKREFAIDAMDKLLSEAYKTRQEDYKKEARYYLEVNDYDLSKAIEEFEADMNFEKQVVQDNRQYRNQQRRQRVGIFSCFG